MEELNAEIQELMKQIKEAIDKNDIETVEKLYLEIDEKQKQISKKYKEILAQQKRAYLKTSRLGIIAFIIIILFLITNNLVNIFK